MSRTIGRALIERSGALFYSLNCCMGIIAYIEQRGTKFIATNHRDRETEEFNHATDAALDFLMRATGKGDWSLTSYFG